MPRLNYVKSAQKDIYVQGKYVNYESKKGKRIGQTLSKLDRTVPKDKNDKIYIAKGEPYYWWQFKNGGKNISKTRPRNSQLTQSTYMSTLYQIMEQIEDASPSDVDELVSLVEDINLQVEDLRDTTQESLDNMPEGLQQGSTGELLQERIDALDSAISELEDIDTDFEEKDDDELREELSGDVDYTPTEEEDADDSFDLDEKKKELVTDDMIQEKKDELAQEWIDEKMEELGGVSFEG